MAKESRLQHPPSVLMKRTQELLREAKVSYREIDRALNISPNWLSQFVNDEVPDPSVNRVECLYTYLNGSPLVIG